MTSVCLNHLLKGTVSKYRRILRSGELGLEHMNFWEDIVPPLTQSKSQVRSLEDAFANTGLRAKIPSTL